MHSVLVWIISFHLNVAFKLQGLSVIFRALASTWSKYSAVASVLGEIELKATGRVYLAKRNKSNNWTEINKVSETQLCPQCSGFLRDWLIVPLPPALLSGPNSTRTSSLSWLSKLSRCKHSIEQSRKETSTSTFFIHSVWCLMPKNTKTTWKSY